MKKDKCYYFSLISLVLIITIVIVASCDNNNNEEQDDVISHENMIDEYLFLAQDGYNILDIGTARMIDGLLIHDELIYYIFVELIYISEEDDTYYQIIQIRGIDIHGNISDSISIPISELIHIDIVGFNIDQNGEFIVIVQEYDERRVRSTLNYERYNLVGEILHREELFTIGNHYWAGAHFSENGDIAVIEFSFQNGFSVHIWDDTFTLISNIPLVTNTFAFGTDGVILSRAEDLMAIQIIDIITGEILEEHSFLLDSHITGIYAADESSRFDYFIHTERHLYGFILDGEELNHILDFFESNLNLTTAPFLMTFGPEENIVIAQARYSTNFLDFDVEIELAVLKPMHRSVLEKIDRVVLAGFNFDNPFIDQVMDYNRRNPFQQVIIKDYYNSNSDIDYEQSIVRFHLDLLTGAAPDIIWLNYSRSIDLIELRGALITQGYLSDLYTFIDSDQILNREDFFPNILKGYEDRNGELPIIDNRFLLTTMISVEPSIKRETWTINEFFKAMDNTINLGNTEPLGGLTGVDFILKMIELMNDEFINYNTGKCYFDSETFIHLLELGMTTSVNPDSNSFFYSDPKFDELMNGRQFVDITRFFWLHGWIIDEEETGVPDGFKYDFIGIPSANGGLHLAQFPFSFSIFESSKNKDTAWQFIRESLLPNPTVIFPRYLTLRIDDFEEYMSSASMSIEREDAFWGMINSATVLKEISGTLLALIKESVEDYINGLQTAERTAEIIQSRVSVYLSERS
ncbi:MAG: hypothetical protein LBC73_05985 [Oscillospiraceae bacterium]|jgi:hypothetical protein|nr:hypothetical protein [Oscillospiraceae bacterium]